MLVLKKMLHGAWSKFAAGQPVPTLLGPDNGAGDMSPAHLDGILAAGGADAMTAVTFHESV